MSIGTAVQQLLDVEERRRGGAYGRDTVCIGAARIGSETEMVVAGSMEQLLGIDFGPPLHSLIIPGELHMVESEMLQYYMLDSDRTAL